MIECWFNQSGELNEYNGCVFKFLMILCGIWLNEYKLSLVLCKYICFVLGQLMECITIALCYMCSNSCFMCWIFVEHLKFRMTCECMNISMICRFILMCVWVNIVLYEMYTVFLIFNVIIPEKTKSLPVTSKWCFTLLNLYQSCLMNSNMQSHMSWFCFTLCVSCWLDTLLVVNVC